MDSMKALDDLRNTSGVSFGQASLAMNRYRTYIVSTRSRGSYPQINTYIKIVEALGGHVEVVTSEGEHIRLSADEK